jgi:predicted enzyme related to lactoylglutathione lyase
MASAHGRFAWYELTTTDLAAAKAFYARVVGWDVRDASTPGLAYALFSANGRLAAGAMELPPPARTMGAAPRWTGYVAVEDVDAAAAHIRRLGGTVYIAPTDVPDVSRFAVVADPQAATFALIKWLKSDDAEPAAQTAPSHVGWHDLFAGNGETAFGFYREVFGWHNVDADAGDVGDNGRYLPFAAGGQTLGGISTKPPTVPAPFWLYYFNVGDIDAAAQRVIAGRGQILEGPAEAKSGAFIARCVDPQGAMFALIGAGRGRVRGYFEPAAARDAAARIYVPKKP